MQILILSCNTGEGHNSTARAIAECFSAHGVASTIIDSLSFGIKGESKLISCGHNTIYKYLPHAFGAGYYLLEQKKSKTKKTALYHISRTTVKRLKKYIDEHSFDVILCVHLFPALALTAVKQKHGLDVKVFFVATDYTCYPGVKDLDLDGYFIPHKDITWEYEAAGIPKDIIYPTGLPVSSAFGTSLPKSEARGALGLPTEGKLLLLMGGSLGCGHIKEMVATISKNLSGGDYLAVLCGRNEKLKKQIEKNHLKNVYAIGYTRQVSLYMDSADLLLTKAGGLSSTEAARKGLPILFFDAVPGCETKNLYFFSHKQYAKTIFDEHTLPHIACELLRDDDTLRAMSERIRADFAQDGAEGMYAIIRQLCAPKHP
ncbi:MAG: hypothetical protein J6R42_06000 [Clostridia bacterium]|nr:hypothetical protein [Clostridia bacterium]